MTVVELDLHVFAEQVQPLEDRVIVLPDPPDDLLKEYQALRDSEFSVQSLDPSSRPPPPQRGTVLAVGDGAMKDGTTATIGVCEGDRVLFSAYASSEWDWVAESGEKVELITIRSSDVFAKLKQG